MMLDPVSLRATSEYSGELYHGRSDPVYMGGIKAKCNHGRRTFMVLPDRNSEHRVDFGFTLQKEETNNSFLCCKVVPLSMGRSVSCGAFILSEEISPF